LANKDSPLKSFLGGRALSWLVTELRTLRLLGRSPNTSTILSVHFVLVIFRDGSHVNYLPLLALNLNPPKLSLSSN
jgi:hypothetical protein